MFYTLIFEKIVSLLTAKFSPRYLKGPFMGILDLVGAATTIGISLSIDVVLWAITKFHDKRLDWRSCTMPITVLHVVFLAVGYGLFWGSGTVFPEIASFLSIVCFILVALLVYEKICESIDHEPWFSISGLVSRCTRLERHVSSQYIAALAVSWDALVIGPSLTDLSTVAHWTFVEGAVCLLVIGIVIALITQGTLLLSSLLNHTEFSALTLSRLFRYGTMMELSVIGGFGILSLWHGLSDTGNLTVCILLSTTLMIIVWQIFLEEMHEHFYAQAVEAIENKLAT